MKKILIVDDDSITLRLMEDHLSLQGYEVTTALDGFKALEKIEKNKFDLIISDVMMPNLSGLSLLSLLKTYYFDNTPIILVSSLDKSNIIIRSLGLGANNFLVKPIDFEALTKRVAKLLEPTSFFNPGLPFI